MTRNLNSRRTGIVVTTIFEPAFLAGYLQDLRAFQRDAATTLYIIADRKTPPAVAQAAERARREGFDVRCPSLDEQQAWLKSIDAPEDFIPWNTDNRRNIGFLMALADGAEVLISIDDDNFCRPETDFVGAHHVVGNACSDPVARSSDGWFNICDQLGGWGRNEVFARGFPYFAQRSPRTTTTAAPDPSLTVAMNAGLWLDDPDVDAIYRLCRRPNGTSFRGNSVVLGPDTWSPINTQNTALTRSAALCYYYVRMGFPLQGLRIDRFGDILSGYLTQKVVKHLGQGVRIGTPIVDHHRTQHNLFKDLYHELAGIVLIEEFVPWLIAARLEGRTPLDAYQSLAEQMLAAADSFKGFIWDDGGRDFLKETAGL
ncbi:MAG: hypothetical protein JNG89_02525, partial [Planctomycetaceae bacterium]|nr:hypothetical protein [Planctomycetaceae bacterium]